MIVRPKPLLHYLYPAEFMKECYVFNMAETSTNTRVGDLKKTKAKKERVWSETELKYFAIVLTDDKKRYAVRLETIALKKSANNEVFDDIAQDFKTCLHSNEFIEENEREKAKSKKKGKDTALEFSPARLRVKFKFNRNQWQKFTDRVKKGSGKAPILEPEWFTILNAVFSDTMGEIDASSCSHDVFLSRKDNSSSDSDKESISFTYKSGTPNPSALGGTDNSDDNDDITNTNSSSSGRIKRKQKARQEIKPSFQKRVKSQAEAIQNMAKSFSNLGEVQQRRTELFTEAEKERQAEFLSFQREQADLNRQHEMTVLQLMRYTRPNEPSHQIPQQQPTHNNNPYSGVNLSQYRFEQSQISNTHNTTLTELEPTSPSQWYEHINN